MSAQTLCSKVSDSRNAAANAVEITALDGLPLRGRVYEPMGRTHTTILALPGIGVDIARPRSVDDLLQRFGSADVARVDVTPEPLGRQSMGHVGLFRPTNTERVWKQWLHFTKETNHDY